MKVTWYCSLRNAHDSAPVGCTAHGEYLLTEDEEIDWRAGITPSLQCHRCHSILEAQDHYELIDPYEDPPLDDWEPPLREHCYEVGDYVLHEGGVWKVRKTSTDPFDEREQKLAVEWIAGSRMGKIIYATGVRGSDVRELTEMEVIAFSTVAESPEAS